MARMHSRKKGTAGSARPYRTSPPEWFEYKNEDIEELVVKLGKEGRKPSSIGITLRDQHGVPHVKLVTGKRVEEILEKAGLKKEIPEDIMSLIVKAVSLETHLNANKKDMSSKRGIQLTESKIRRLVKYYKRTNRIPKDWEYSLSSAKLLVK